MLDGTIRDGGAQFGGLMPGFGAVLDRDQRVRLWKRLPTTLPKVRTDLTKP